MTAHARNDDPITSHEAAATVDTNRSQAAVLKVIQLHLPERFTLKMAVATYARVVARQPSWDGPEKLPHLSESRVRSAVRELQRMGRLQTTGYTDPKRGRRELIWTLAAQAERRGGPWTRHGHVIDGVTVAGSGRPPVVRCGGPRLCQVCQLDADDERRKAVQR